MLTPTYDWHPVGAGLVSVLCPQCHEDHVFSFDAVDRDGCVILPCHRVTVRLLGPVAGE